MTDAASGPASPRRPYIDWLRGLAVLCMIVWHVVDAWHTPEGRDTPAFAMVVFFAGWAAPLFLFLAGVSLPMAAASRMAQGLDRVTAARTLVIRGGQVFLLAHLFRLQSFLLNPNSSWSGLLKPDILNVLGLGIVMVALAWRYSTSVWTRVAWLLVPAVVVAALLTPWAPAWWWPTLLHPRLEGYLRVVNGNAVFSLFPAVAYVFAGAFTGSIMVESKRSERRFHSRSSIIGLGLLTVAIGSWFVPLPAGVQHWTGPLLIVMLRVGAMLVMLAVLWLLLRNPPVRRTSPMLILGRASLVVYWVLVELAYGTFSRPLHKALSMPGALSGVVLVTLLMYGLGGRWLQRPKGAPLVPSHMVASPHVWSQGHR